MSVIPIGKAIAQVRHERGLTQHQFAAKAAMLPSHIGKIEAAFLQPTLKTLDHVAKTLNTEAWRLVRYAEHLRNLEVTNEPTTKN